MLKPTPDWLLSAFSRMPSGTVRTVNFRWVALKMRSKLPVYHPVVLASHPLVVLIASPYPDCRDVLFDFILSGLDLRALFQCESGVLELVE